MFIMQTTGSLTHKHIQNIPMEMSFLDKEFFFLICRSEVTAKYQKKVKIAQELQTTGLKTTYFLLRSVWFNVSS